MSEEKKMSAENPDLVSEVLSDDDLEDIAGGADASKRHSEKSAV